MTGFTSVRRLARLLIAVAVMLFELPTLLLFGCEAGPDREGPPIGHNSTSDGSVSSSGTDEESGSTGGSTGEPDPDPGCEVERLISWRDALGEPAEPPVDAAAAYVYSDNSEKLTVGCGDAEGTPGCWVPCARADVLGISVDWTCDGQAEHATRPSPLSPVVLLDACLPGGGTESGSGSTG